MKSSSPRSILHVLGLLTLLLLTARPGTGTIARMASDVELIQSSRLIVQGQIRFFFYDKYSY